MVCGNATFEDAVDILKASFPQKAWEVSIWFIVGVSGTIGNSILIYFIVTAKKDRRHGGHDYFVLGMICMFKLLYGADK